LRRVRRRLPVRVYRHGDQHRTRSLSRSLN
jgi:hypothetical protein